ncbi:MAG: response regulator transcription factor [Thermoflexales bacterium]|nr:response regulator transcription factor [Thermoflexales bacterium]
MSPEEFLARILIVDDEPATCMALTRALTLMGYRVDSALSGQEALDRLKAAPYDVMVLDLRLPDIRGEEILQQARQIWPDLLVIILTAYASLDSAIAAVRAGAVDYLLKPYSIRALEEAIARALHRRREQMRREHLLRVIAEAVEQLGLEGPAETPVVISPGRFLRQGRLTLDREKRVVIIAEPLSQEEKEISLTGNEAALLEYLMERPELVISCRELAQNVLGYRDLTEREAETLIRPLVFRLRKKIEPDPDQPIWVRTVRGKGYFFSA